MPMCVRVSEPRLLPELMDSFLRNHCVALRVDRDACVVVHVQAADADEAWQEVGFFLRAWQAHHPHVVIARTADG